MTGWNYYTASDPSQIGAGQYDFSTLAIHELGHAIGLGESQDPASVMFATLQTGQAKRSLVTADLDIPDADSGPCALHAATDAGLDLATSIAIDGSIALTTQDPVEGDIPLTIDPVALGTLPPEGRPNSRRADRSRPPSIRPAPTAAIEALVHESYLVPLEIAQDFPGSPGDDVRLATSEATARLRLA